MTPFPWSDAMKFGFGVLRLGAKEFWALTPLELSAAYKALHPESAEPMNRETMEDLMIRFPDKEHLRD